MLGKDGLECAQALWRLDVADNADDDHWWRLDDGDGLNGLLLVQLGAQLVDITDNVIHTILVADEGGQMDWLGRVILWEGFTFTTVSH